MVRGFALPGSQLFQTHRRLLPVLWACPSFAAAPRACADAVTVPHGMVRVAPCFLELGRGTTASITRGVLQAHTCLCVCACEKESRGTTLSPLHRTKSMRRCPKAPVLIISILSFVVPFPEQTTGIYKLESAICSATSLFSCEELICKSSPCSVTASGESSCMFSL